MAKHDCGVHFKRPKIQLPPFKRTKQDQDLAKKLAAEIARIAVLANSGEDDRLRPCSLADSARRRFNAMSEKERALALRYSQTLAAGAGGDSDREEMDPDLLKAVRRFARRQFDSIREQSKTAITDLQGQARGQALLVTKTWVKMRPAGEVVVTPHRYLQTDEPPSLTFHWGTDEPEAARAYWELRGPVTGSDPGPLITRGFAESTNKDGTVGGEYTLHLNQYLPPAAPNPAQRYHMTVLPLGAPDTGLKLERHHGHSISSILTRGEPEPPAGVGPWSGPAVIDYGGEYKQPGTHFDLQRVNYYRKSRLHINWFKVAADQPGPGDEEYRISAFAVDISPLEATPMGKWLTYLPVEEGDTSRHALDWTSAWVKLWTPTSNVWPRTQFAVISVHEEDSGDGVDDWLAAMAELASEALEGDLMDEVRDYLRDMQDELDDATEEFNAALTSEFAAYVIALIGASAIGAVIAVITYIISLIATFAGAGASDDFYGVEVVTLGLMTNDVSQWEGGTGATLDAPLYSGGFQGQEVGNRFETREIEVQLIAPGGPDGAGLGGIVRVGLHWEFADKVTDYI
ncbi:hypothetical protein [Pelagibius sp. Alg239-R121]|uniref:hypothetical protein n=1 Tax=Pelagibius sp. Alg239-R121 TaxID=2993448 RepID=UPI0024A6827F|nr:hypothetical protein [Pelagibius sp. Alg239-R121]